MTWGICVGGAIRMLSQVIHFKGINTGYFSQDTRGVMSHTICAVLTKFSDMQLGSYTLCFSKVMLEHHLLHAQ